MIWPVTSHGKGPCFCETSEVPWACPRDFLGFTQVQTFPATCNGSYCTFGRDIQVTYAHHTCTCMVCHAHCSTQGSDHSQHGWCAAGWAAGVSPCICESTEEWDHPTDCSPGYHCHHKVSPLHRTDRQTTLHCQGDSDQNTFNTHNVSFGWLEWVRKLKFNMFNEFEKKEITYM